MPKKILSSKKGETYIDIAIVVVAIVMFLVLSLNIFTVVTLKNDLDRIAEELLDTATYSGAFGDAFDERVTALKEKYFDFEVGIYAEKYYNSSLKQVQYGDTMAVTVSVTVSVGGIGIEIPLDLSVERMGRSEQYWKTSS